MDERKRLHSIPNIPHHRREWSAAEFPSVCMALLAV